MDSTPPACNALNAVTQHRLLRRFPSLCCKRRENRPRASNKRRMHSMSRVSIAQRTKLSMHFARRSLRKIAGRLKGHQLLRWDLIPAKTDRLVIAPQDLRTAD